MKKTLKPPMLSTSFSGNAKEAKTRFDNILNSKKKTGIIIFCIAVAVIAIAGFCFGFSTPAPTYEKSAVLKSDGHIYYDEALTTSAYELEKNDLLEILYETDGAYYVRRAVMDIPAAEGYVAKTAVSFEFKTANQGILNGCDIYNSPDEADIYETNSPSGRVCAVYETSGDYTKVSLIGGVDGKWVKTENISYDIAAKEKQGENYSAVWDFMQAEFRKTYSKYYDGVYVDKISNYTENFDKNTAKLEAEFFMTGRHRNYYKDPDAVEYIKEAKTNGSKHYLTYYNEYNMMHDANFHLKLVATIENGKINGETAQIYSNASPKGISWSLLEKNFGNFIMSENEE